MTSALLMPKTALGLLKGRSSSCPSRGPSSRSKARSSAVFAAASSPAIAVRRWRLGLALNYLTHHTPESRLTDEPAHFLLTAFLPLGFPLGDFRLGDARRFPAQLVERGKALWFGTDILDAPSGVRVGFCLNQNSTSWRSRLAEVPHHRSSSSIRIARRPRSFAARPVVPEPAKGSSTISPRSVVARMQRRGMVSGNSTGCSLPCCC